MKDILDGKVAPPFHFPTPEGGTLDLPTTAAATLVLFFRSDCPTCRLAAPIVERMHRMVAGHRVRIWGVHQGDADAAAAASADLGLTFPLAYDAHPSATARTWGLDAVPTVVLIDDEHRVAWSQEGFVKKAYETLALDLALRAECEPEPLFTVADDVPERQPGCAAVS